MSDEFDPLLGGQQMLAMFRNPDSKVQCRKAQVQIDENNKTEIKSCIFIIPMEFVYFKPQEDGSPPLEENLEKSKLAQIYVEIALDYVINTPDFPDAESLEGWAKGNALLHAWPYWREYCQNCLSRMILPPATIPLIQIPTAK